jgi:hypothetical protein
MDYGQSKWQIVIWKTLSFYIPNQLFPMPSLDPEVLKSAALAIRAEQPSALHSGIRRGEWIDPENTEVDGRSNIKPTFLFA